MDSSEQQILAEFYETQPHFTESGNVQSVNENHAGVIQLSPQTIIEENAESMQDEGEEIVVEFSESESESTEESETKENTPQASEMPHAIEVFSQSPGSCSHRPFSDTETQKSNKRSTASAPPIYENKSLQTIKKRPSTTNTFRRKLTSRDFKRKITLSQSRPDRRNSAPIITRPQETYNFSQSSTTTRASTAGPSLRNFTPESVIEVGDANELEPNTSRQTRIGSAKLAVRNRLADLLRAEMKIRGMKEEVRRNLFAPSLQILEATLFLGPLVFMIPFTIQIRNGEYTLETGILRMTISAVLLLGSTFFHAFTTYEILKETTVKDVQSITNSIDSAAMLLVLLAFGYSVTFCQSRFRSLFQTFGVRFFRESDELRGHRFKTILWTLLPFLFCILMGSWTAWGEIARVYGFGAVFETYQNHEIGSYIFGDKFKAQKVSHFLVACFIMLLDTFGHCVIMYTELFIWAASLSIYWMEKKKRAYCLQPNVAFDLVEGTAVFGDLHEVVNRRLSKPLGPLLAISCITLVTYNVSGLDILCFGTWRWHVPIIMIIKAGHVLVAAEAMANDENLLHQVLTKRIGGFNNSGSGQSEVANLEDRLTFESQLREFKDASREPMSLKALDFADINYSLFGWVLVSAIGYFLVVAEWRKEELNECMTMSTTPT